MKKILLILLISIEIFAGTQMCGSGTVIRLLSDDNTGSRHQRFIIKQSSGRTLLIAHNIDIAPKIYSLKKRPLNNPLICHFKNKQQVEENFEISQLDYYLIDLFWPGPLTLILKKKDNSYISPFLSNNLKISFVSDTTIFILKFYILYFIFYILYFLKIRISVCILLNY